MKERSDASLVTILDATVRDGSYANPSFFRKDKVASLVEGLRRSGVHWIEIGHGYGLGAERIMTPMPATDREYLEYLVPKGLGAKLGMFANANIASKDDITDAAALGLEFVRVGFIGFNSPHPFKSALKLVEKAKESGLWVSLNAVRTQFLSDKDLVKIAEEGAQVGVDALYVVDSTGGALPSKVTHQVRVLKEHFPGTIGFHGHDNLRLGIANCLAAADAGANMLDGTIGGIGRDSGNAQLEVLAASLTKAGFQTGIDIESLFACRNSEMSECFGSNVGISEYNLLLGRYDIMTHGLKILTQLSSEYGVSLLELAERVADQCVEFECEESLKGLLTEAER